MKKHPAMGDHNPSMQEGYLWSRLPVALALLLSIFGGVFLINRADTQARDTIRKHHLEDIEQALYFAQKQQGTFPPYDQPYWCGYLNAPESAPVTAQIEASLRAQHEKYANPDKPFPTDPKREFSSSNQGYFYWKQSPTAFQLFSKLETDINGNRSTHKCNSIVSHTTYDYGLTSIWREQP